MRTIEFLVTKDDMIYAVFKLNGNTVNLRFVGYNHNIGQTIRDWLLDGEIPSSMN